LFAAQNYDKENLRIYRTSGDDSTPQLAHTIAENPDDRRRVYATDTYFSPDGRSLLVVTSRPEVRLFNTSTWEQVTDTTLIPPGAIGYTPSADWKLGVAQLGPNQTLLWDTVNHRTIAPLKLDGKLTWAAFSPDDQVLTFATTPTEGQTHQVSRLSTETLLKLPELWPAAWHSKVSGPLLWWGNGRFLIAGFSAEYTAGGLALWNSSTGRLVGTFQGCVNSGESLVLQGNRLLSVCPVVPDYPGGVTDWTMDEVLKTATQWEDSQAANQ
jgi:WD40 repeat protein